MSLFVGTNPEKNSCVSRSAQNRQSLLQKHAQVKASRSRSNQSITATNQTCQTRTRLESSLEWLWNRVQLAQWRTYMTDHRHSDRYCIHFDPIAVNLSRGLVSFVSLPIFYYIHGFLGSKCDSSSRIVKYTNRG